MDDREDALDADSRHRLEEFAAWTTAPGPTVATRAPGRVNLIGEHTDYNQGYVLPVAIDREVSVLGRTVPRRTVRVLSHAIGEEASFSLDEMAPDPNQPWLNYIIGMAAGLRVRGIELPGMELMLWSDVPLGAGLSSSAAYEMAVMRAFELLGGFELEPNAAIDVAQQAEWEFTGTRSGIMDQTISQFGHAGDALLLDSRWRRWCQVPLNTEADIVICNSGVPRRLANSAYNERRDESERAVQALRASLPGITALRDVSPLDWERLEDTLPEPLRRRARHVITEDARVPEAAAALAEGDLPRLARLFAASHRSLRDDYEVSAPELDILVAIAHEVAADIPSRLTGAGFGGCTVQLVPPGLVPEFERRVREEYPRRTGREPMIYRCRSANGASGHWVER